MGGKDPKGDMKVFSPICTHLGCGYRWDDGTNKFQSLVTVVRST